MKNKKNKIIILIALVLSLTLLGIFQLKRTGKQEYNAPNVQIAFNQVDNFSQVENIIKEILDEGIKEIDESHLDLIVGKYKNFEQLRDPFTFIKTRTPASTKKLTRKKQKASMPKLELRGIIFDKENPVAIINGEVYREGDLIKNFRVVRITKDGVKLVSRNNQLYLKAPEFN
jgi:hypothetical protein